METNKKRYDTRFFQGNRDDRKLASVKTVLNEAMIFLPEIHSAVDFGCGVGTWLAGLQNFGVSEIKGFDGNWVNRDLLVIPQDCFEEVDFDKEVKLNKKYDLAVSIEVAEHLLEKSAKSFIKTLTNASDIILFSAAIPGQGGDNHVNEQWPEYWNKLFNENGFIAVDCLRKRLWDKEDILEFHSQNIMFFVRNSKQAEIKATEGDFCIDRAPMPIINHKRYLRMVTRDLSLMSFFMILINANKWLLINLIGKENSKKIYRKYFKK